MPNESVEIVTYNNHNIEIIPDVDLISPRENDNICQFHIAHRRYSFGDVNHNCLETVQEAEQEAINKI